MIKYQCIEPMCEIPTKPETDYLCYYDAGIYLAVVIGISLIIGLFVALKGEYNDNE